MKKILVPTDFSKTANIAAEVGSDIARRSGAELILLHVVEGASQSSISIMGETGLGNMEDTLFTMKLIERSKKSLAKAAADPKFKDVKISAELRMGTPYHGMQSIISEKKVDLVIMGTAGHSRLEEMIIGSNTEKVVRHAHCPVLTVNKKPDSLDFKNIVYATSMSKEEEVFSRIVRNTQKNVRLYGSPGADQHPCKFPA